jgi:peptidyl-prolyl cis-trans isomerase B (cyclophilin B)
MNLETAPASRSLVKTPLSETNVKIETSLGDIEIELNKEASPETVSNFLQYVKEEYYNNTVFHRVISNFMIQGGGYEREGGGKDPRGPIKSEANNGLKNERGTVAMARTNDPNSAKAQFFINVNNNSFLNHSNKNAGYTVFGKVSKGMDVVDKIRTTKTTVKNGSKDWPVDEVVMKKVYIKQ